MLDAIRFTAPAAAKKDFVPELTHFLVEGGRITGFNGQMALSSPIGVDLVARPKATAFLAAVKACGAAPIALHLTDAGRLAVRAGNVRVYVQCVDAHLADILQPSGEAVELGENFMLGVRTLAPIMGTDASRPWAMGIKVGPGSMFATNNVVMAQFWHGAKLPFDVVIPSPVIRELLRVGEAPSRVQVEASKITFWFADDRSMTSLLLDGTLWPLSKIEQLLDRPNQLAASPPLPGAFFDALETLAPFVDEKTTRVFVTAAGLRTSLAEGEGAAVDFEFAGVPDAQPYNLRQLATLATVATTVEWSAYPAPCLFCHDKLPVRGAIAGQRA